MADIFISYAREDEERIRPLAEALEAQGWSVFWDRRIPAGQTWRSLLGQALHDARCVIVAWSRHSVASKWVTEEADAGQQRGILVPVLLEKVEPPIGFRSLQAADIGAWLADSNSPHFAQFVQDIRNILGAPTPLRTIPTAQPTAHKRWYLSRTAIAGIGVVVVAFVGAAYFYSRPVSEPATAVSSSPASTAGSPGGALAPTTSKATPPSKATVSPVGAFAITIGDKVSDGVPAPGAGIIASQFEHDVYRFTAAPRQTVYFRVPEISRDIQQSYLGWRLVDEDGTEVFRQGLYTGDPGVHTLVKGGRYTLTVGSNEDPAVGVYQFQLYNVPRPDQFTIEIGAKIQDGQPGPGAGHIETPGAKDVYTFTAAPRQKVYFRVHNISTAIDRSYLGWRLVDEDGTEVFSQGLYVGHPGVHPLMKGGVYTLTVGSNSDPATGTYQVQIGAQD